MRRISDFKRAIRAQHGVDAQIIGGETAIIPRDGATPVDLLVLIFHLFNHPSARRCYTWEADGQVVSVLHAGSVDSPQAAVGSTLAPSLRVVEGGNAASVSWSFRTTVGVLRIKPSQSRPGRFVLSLDEEQIRTYQSAEIAADDVGMAMTGGPRRLDEVLETEAPTELGEWTRHER